MTKSNGRIITELTKVKQITKMNIRCELLAFKISFGSFWTILTAIKDGQQVKVVKLLNYPLLLRLSHFSLFLTLSAPLSVQSKEIPNYSNEQR